MKGCYKNFKSYYAKTRADACIAQTDGCCYEREDGYHECLYSASLPCGTVEKFVNIAKLSCPKDPPVWTDEPRVCPKCKRMPPTRFAGDQCETCRLEGMVDELNARRIMRTGGRVRPAKTIESGQSYPRNMKWAVGVTTAPRQVSTLDQCLGSLRNAGWASEVTVFAEPNSPVAASEHVVVHKQRKGVWHNWLHAANHLLSNTDAELLMTVQDDAVFHPDCREFAEQILWPSAKTGAVSLYTAKHYSQRVRFAPGIYAYESRGFWGALALIWPRHVLQQAVDHRIANRWTGTDGKKRSPEKIANSDTAIGAILSAMRKELYMVQPSPVQHVAKHSTINHGGNRGRRNCYFCADHRTPLAEQVLP